MPRQEKRKDQRFKMVLPVRYAWVEQSVRRQASGSTRDVSSRGTFILSSVVLSLGTRVELEVALDGLPHTLQCKGVVVRNEFAGFATSGRVRMTRFEAPRDFDGVPAGAKHV